MAVSVSFLKDRGVRLFDLLENPRDLRSHLYHVWMARMNG